LVAWKAGREYIGSLPMLDALCVLQQDSVAATDQRVIAIPRLPQALAARKRKNNKPSYDAVAMT
jgi:hypothetical protein